MGKSVESGCSVDLSPSSRHTRGSARTSGAGERVVEHMMVPDDLDSLEGEPHRARPRGITNATLRSHIRALPTPSLPSRARTLDQKMPQDCEKEEKLEELHDCNRRSSYQNGTDFSFE